MMILVGNIGAAGGNPDFDWRFTTVPQEGAGDRPIPPTQLVFVLYPIKFDTITFTEASYWVVRVL